MPSHSTSSASSNSSSASQSKPAAVTSGKDSKAGSGMQTEGHEGGRSPPPTQANLKGNTEIKEPVNKSSKPLQLIANLIKNGQGELHRETQFVWFLTVQPNG
jgi:hypothetical protein